jgi:hypothetical protein
MRSRLSDLLRGKLVRVLAIALILACIAGVAVSRWLGKAQEPALSRSLAYLPPLPVSPAPVGSGFTVTFADIAELKKQHGYGEDLPLGNLPVSMVDDFLEALDQARICTIVDAHLQSSRAQMDIGYDVMTAERCIEGGGVTVLEGDFDPRLVAESLGGLGYRVDEHAGFATYHYDTESYTGDDAGRGLAESAGHVAVVRKAIVIAAAADRLHTALEMLAGRSENLSDDLRFEVLSDALGPAVSAGFLLQERQPVGIGYYEFTTSEREAVFAPIYWPPPSRDTAPNWWEDRETTYHERLVIIASTHTTVEDAQTEGVRLKEELEMHPLAHQWREVSEPAFADSEGGVVLTIALALTDDAPAGVPPEIVYAWR